MKCFNHNLWFILKGDLEASEMIEVSVGHWRYWETKFSFGNYGSFKSNVIYDELIIQLFIVRERERET